MGFEAEDLERATLADLHAAAPRALTDELGLRALSAGSALVSVGAALPASAIVINRTIGLGLPGPEFKETVQAIAKIYRDAEVARYFVHRHPAAQPAALVEWFGETGLEKARGWQKFSRGREPAPPVETDLHLTTVGPEHGPAFGRIVCEAFDLGEQAAPWLAMLPGRPGWHVVMSFDGDTPAGAGTLFVKDGLGWLDFGATASTHRRRGSHAAVLARRIALALELGCRALFTCTGEAVPGDPQHSYRNILKAGFREDYVRENYAPPKG